MPLNHPGEVEHYAFFSAHLGARFQSAGLRVQFHYNQESGIHFAIQPPEEYAESIIKGLSDGLARYFPSFPDSGSVWIKEVVVHDIDSSQAAFYRAGLLVMSQAFALAESVASDIRTADSA
ncbi:hypothetical protein GJ698_03240 [Pseudoduganella sp. FT26W]|uniref:Uncharacterized protein n=1 Tax=Duganella aquatilis TaxID=2666082 RepID=A0A844CZZ9_9BURK|nr:hypothetical protein [Duganella aquatilis]MRW83105.1 hypothetical protein [Duganella aquatilis]